MSMPATFGETAMAMFANGYTSAIPLAPDTKRPILEGWSNLNTNGWSSDELEYEILCSRYAACGWAVDREHLALDLDIMDEGIAAEVNETARQELGDTPLVRIGLEPKSVLIYRSDGSIRSSKPHPIEIYSGTGQVAVFGHHVRAGRPYLWPRASLLDTPADSPDVPIVTSAALARFLQISAKSLEPLKRPRKGLAPLVGVDAHERLKQLLVRLPFDLAARQLLAEATDGGRHYAVYAILTTAKRRGIDEERVVRVIEREGDVLDYVGPDYLERTLDSVFGQSNPAIPEFVRDLVLSRHNLNSGRSSC